MSFSLANWGNFGWYFFPKHWTSIVLNRLGDTIDITLLCSSFFCSVNIDDMIWYAANAINIYAILMFVFYKKKRYSISDFQWMYRIMCLFFSEWVCVSEWGHTSFPHYLVLFTTEIRPSPMGKYVRG